MKQIGFHPLENDWNYVVWLLLFHDLNSRRQSKTKTIKLHLSPTIMQQADEAVSNRETKCMKVSTMRVIQCDKTQYSNRHEYITWKHDFFLTLVK